MSKSSGSSNFELIVWTTMPGSKLRRTWPLDGGMSAQMAAIEVETPIGQTVKRIVRWHNDWTYRCNPHAVVEEFKTLQLAHTLELAAPTPYHLDESCSIFSKPYMVVEYIEGNPKFTLPPGFDFTFNLAKHLARIGLIEKARAIPKDEIVFRGIHLLEDEAESLMKTGVIDRVNHLAQRAGH